MRRILVTGGNKGIGLAIVRKILVEEERSFVLLGSRDRQRGDEARSALLTENADWADRLEVLEIDVASDASVQAAKARVVERFASEATPLFGIVNNAGIGLGSEELERVLQVNAFGPRRVCEAFLPLLDPSQARIVNLTSASGPNFVAKCSEEWQRFFLDPQIEWSKLEAFMKDCIATEPGDFEAKGLGDGNAYGLSKACANSYTMLLARENPKLLVNACTPGFIATDLTRPYATSQGKDPADLGMKPTEAGAVAPCFLLFGEPEGTGHYYGSDAKRSPLDRYRAPGTAPFTG